MKNHKRIIACLIFVASIVSFIYGILPLGILLLFAGAIALQRSYVK
jgi:hypothetical protein